MTPPPRLWVGRDELRGLANRIDEAARRMRDERAALPGDDAYLAAVASLDEVIDVERAAILVRRIADRRP